MDAGHGELPSVFVPEFRRDASAGRYPSIGTLVHLLRIDVGAVLLLCYVIHVQVGESNPLAPPFAGNLRTGLTES